MNDHSISGLSSRRHNPIDALSNGSWIYRIKKRKQGAECPAFLSWRGNNSFAPHKRDDMTVREGQELLQLRNILGDLLVGCSRSEAGLLLLTNHQFSGFRRFGYWRLQLHSIPTPFQLTMIHK